MTSKLLISSSIEFFGPNLHTIEHKKIKNNINKAIPK